VVGGYNPPPHCPGTFARFTWYAVHYTSLHPRKWRTRAPVLTGGPGAAPGGVASKNGWGHMRVRGGGVHFLLTLLLVCCLCACRR